jgi:hypothetical protein
MTNFIPVFPLGIVVYPGEELNLHIFEPKYKQLINDCFETKKPFGIPTVIDGKIVEMGTIVIIKEISKRYDDGQLDVKTEGIQPFKILELVKELPEKLYGGAIVNYPQIINVGSPSLLRFILDGIRKLHLSLNVEKVFKKEDEKLLSYDLAHHAGMNLQDEYYLLELELEIHRQEFLKRHVVKLLEVMQEMEALKQKIGLNGHFKNLEGFNL